MADESHGFRLVRTVTDDDEDEADSGSGYDMVLEEGDSFKLGDGTWKSFDSSVVKVSKKGKATAVGEGTATLTSSSGKKLVIKVEEE